MTESAYHSAADAGHLFVIHGKIEELTHDAAIVPVDARLNLTDLWAPLLSRPLQEPQGWRRNGWGRVLGTDVWLVEVGDGGPYVRVLDRLRAALEDIRHTVCRPPAGGRTYPLVAVPPLGVRRGGHHRERGNAVASLVDALTKAGEVRRSPIDLALITPSASLYGAAQFARRRQRRDQHGPIDRTARDLGQRAGAGELALFLGAGVSIPAGLPSWNSLLETLSAPLSKAEAGLLKDLNATDKAELIEKLRGGEPTSPKASALQEAVVSETRTAERPSLLHGLLAGLDARTVVTTNYDDLYERAVRATNRKTESVLPWTSALGAERWVLKLHGDVKHPESIVLTRRHMVMYDALNRPSAAMLQSLLLTKHVLFVGASFSDDNVIRLAHEVEAYRDHFQRRGDKSDCERPRPFGTVITVSPEAGDARSRLWDGQLTWCYLGSDAGLGFRAQEILLDKIGMYASRDSSWLLDDRFTDLLPSERDRTLAEQARRLASELEKHSDRETWQSLVDALDSFGAYPRGRRF